MLSATIGSTLHPTGSIYTVEMVNEDVRCVRRGREDHEPNHQSFEMAVVEFRDDGALVDREQLEEAADCITKARHSNCNGALVVVFIHGWHHNATWCIESGHGDQHFAEFRGVLMRLAVREAERYKGDISQGRRVVGLYLGWNGDPPSWPWWLWSNFSFLNRYSVAEKIGGGDSLREAIKTIVARTKRPEPEKCPGQPESPLILIGHSMGALMLEAAFGALLKQEPKSLREPASEKPRVVGVQCRKDLVSFPDVLLALNSAADSQIAKTIIDQLKKQEFSKTLAADGIRYAPPLFVSVTSTADWATKWAWLVPQVLRLRPWRKTDGHDKSLYTHCFVRTGDTPCCSKKPGPDFGQDWHCLRYPEPKIKPTPAFAIDLPERKRISKADEEPPHARYRLEPRNADGTHLAWVFQLGPDISKEHNDIFNFRSTLLVLALIQISGAVMSLAEDIKSNFEHETCCKHADRFNS